MRIGPFGIWEILIIAVVAILVFGPRRLPEMAKGLGQSVREFRKGIRDMRNEFQEDAATPVGAASGSRSTAADAGRRDAAAPSDVTPAAESAAARPSTPA